MLQQGAELGINSMLDQMLNPQSYVPATGYTYITTWLKLSSTTVDPTQ